MENGAPRQELIDRMTDILRHELGAAIWLAWSGYRRRQTATAR